MRYFKNKWERLGALKQESHRRAGILSCSIACLLLCSTLAFGQQDLRNIPTPDPQAELAAFKLPDGYEINLWAADPLLAKPTQISFDRQGRLWASTSETYPQLNVNQEPSDRIVILEDTNQDGVADKSSVFYDELIIPGGVLPDGEGGAYVAHAEQLIHLQDTDDDGKADKKTVLLTGFGTEDTHHTLHRLRWGPGGLMYMLQGYYIGSHVETLYGPRRLNGGGLWSYDTRTRRLEIYSRGLTNPWGARFDRWGQSFQTDGAGGEGINYSFPDAVFRSSPHENRILHGLNPNRPKSCGLAVISGNHFPESMRHSLLTADFRANNIDRYVIDEQDSGYSSELQEDMLASTHVSFRPIDIVMGPDGAIYIADWYSPIIQHGEVDFRDERRDRIHGRIWRITAKGRDLEKSVDYKTRSIEELLDLLKQDADWVRLNAKQELKIRDEEQVESALSSWLAALDQEDPDYEHHRLEALWTYQTISTKRSLDPARELLKSPDHRVRAAATRLFYHWHEAATPKDLAEAADDPHPRVRREAVSALGQMDSPNAISTALLVLDHPMDRFLDFALWRTCRQLESQWLPDFQQGKLKLGNNADRLVFALKAIEKPDTLGPLLETLRSPPYDPAIARLAGKLGSAEQLSYLLEIVNQKNHPLIKSAALGLVEAASVRQLRPNGESQQLSACTSLVESNDPELMAAGCRLIGFWQHERLDTHAIQFMQSDNVPPSVHQAAAFALSELQHPFLTEPNRAPERFSDSARIAAACALVRTTPTAGVQSAVDLLREERSELEIEELLNAVLTKQDALAPFTKALESTSIPVENATQVRRLVETSSIQHAELLSALEKLASPSKPRTMEQLASLVASSAQGDAAKGHAIFQRKELTCVKCHAVNGEGSNIGPDLSSIGAAAPIDYLIESLLAPSEKIKEGYRMSVIITEDGDVYSGTVVREDEQVVLIRNAVGQENRVLKSSIDSRDTSGISMMPSGLTANLSDIEFRDLVAYLASLGKQQ